MCCGRLIIQLLLCALSDLKRNRVEPRLRVLVKQHFKEVEQHSTVTIRHHYTVTTQPHQPPPPFLASSDLQVGGQRRPGAARSDATVVAARGAQAH